MKMKKVMTLIVLVVALGTAIYSIREEKYDDPEFIADAKKLEKLPMFARVPAEERTQVTRNALRREMEKLSPPSSKPVKFLCTFGITGMIGLVILYFCFSFRKFIKKD